MEAPEPPSDPPDGSAAPAPPGSGSLRPAVVLLTLGFSAAAAVAVGGGLGYLVDRWAGTSPVFILIGLLLGMATAVTMTVTQVRRYL